MAANYSEPEPENIAKPEPTPQEIIVPPFVLLVSAFIAILFLWMFTHYCRKYRNDLRSVLVQPTTAPKIAFVNTSTIKRLLNFRDDQQQDTPVPLQNSFSFLSDRDLREIENFACFQNSAKELFSICFPAALTLCFCPLTLLLYKPLVKALWPPDTYTVTPNINEAIACFLVPAGMVYAVSFGFAFQQVLGRQTDVIKSIAYDVRQMNQLISMTKSLRWISDKTRIKMYEALKAQVLSMMRLFMQTDVTGKEKQEQEADIWCIIDHLREVKSPCRDTMDDAICDRFVKYLGCISITNRDVLNSKIHFLEWALLETLGYFTFLGILMVQAQSYQLELTMCIITVVSITMLCYIIADLDNPFNGFFRIDLASVRMLIERLERMYIMTISEDRFTGENNKIPDNGAKSKKRLI